MKLGTRYCLTAAVLAYASIASASAVAADSATTTRQQMSDLQRAAKSVSQARLPMLLQLMAADADTRDSVGNSAATQPSLIQRLRAMRILKGEDGYVVVSAYPSRDVNELLRQISAAGMAQARIQGNAVIGRVPIAALARISQLDALQSLQPVMTMTRSATGTASQGDRSMRSDVARKKFRVDGRNVMVGVLSDSYGCAPGPLFPGQRFTTPAEDVANGDLPPDVLVIKDLSPTPSSGCSDEGRALLQIIHDVAPAAPLAFYTAVISPQDFAQGILSLADAGAKVIVDDVGYFSEAMFQNDVISQAVNTVRDRGVAYFSSAGNDARHSYEASFRDSGKAGLSTGRAHDFDPGAGVDTAQSAVVAAGSLTMMSFQWDEPFASISPGVGSRSDVDVYFTDDAGNPFPLCVGMPQPPVCQVPGLSANIGLDPSEQLILANNSGQSVRVNLQVESVSGPAPGLMKYIYFNQGSGTYQINEFDTQSGAIYGHPNAAGAEAVGAAAYFNTAAFGPVLPGCRAACLEMFSSAGGTALLFDDAGNRFANPRQRFKPGITGPDNGDTSFFLLDIMASLSGITEPNGLPNFPGTSASAPHVAAVAALLVDQRQRDVAAGKFIIGSRQLTPELIFLALRLTANDIRARGGLSGIVSGQHLGPLPIDNARGFDFDSGYGLVDAASAVLLIKSLAL